MFFHTGSILSGQDMMNAGRIIVSVRLLFRIQKRDGRFLYLPPLFAVVLVTDIHIHRNLYFVFRILLLLLPDIQKKLPAI